MSSSRSAMRKRFGALDKASLHLLSVRVPDEAPILGGPARVDSLDKEIAAALVERVGPDQAFACGIDVFDSDWVGTMEALYYVSPTVGSIRRWPWRDVIAVRVVKRRLKLASYALKIRSSRTPLEMITGRKSATRLITFHAACRKYRR